LQHYATIDTRSPFQIQIICIWSIRIRYSTVLSVEAFLLHLQDKEIYIINI
uniref:Ovule protein n=1 Tax=Haemonchus placei TaxID=6290 RepID=A0A0N4VZD2_HAEPC